MYIQIKATRWLPATAFCTNVIHGEGFFDDGDDDSSKSMVKCNTPFPWVYFEHLTDTTVIITASVSKWGVFMNILLHNWGHSSVISH